jgi:hypothetical protein
VEEQEILDGGVENAKGHQEDAERHEQDDAREFEFRLHGALPLVERLKFAGPQKRRCACLANAIPASTG